MSVFDLPDEVTSQDLQKALRIGRSQLSRIRSGKHRFPEPDRSRSTPRRPIWHKADILHWLVAECNEPAYVLPAFDAPPSGPIEQRWTFDRLEFVPVTCHGVKAEVVAMRYSPPNFQDPRTLTICTPVGETPDGPRLRFGPYLDPDVAEALGYHANGKVGAIAFLSPASPNDRPRIIGVNLPDDIRRTAADSGKSPFQLRILDASTVAALIGHPLPYWAAGTVSKAAAAQWRPESPQAPRPVHAGIPPALAAAHQLRIQCRAVLDQIESGQRTAPDPLPAELAHLGNTAWDTTLGRVFGHSWALHEPLPEGWVRTVVPPRLSEDEAEPLLPTQPPSTDLFHALEWLVSQEDLPDDMLRYPISYFGYPDSISVATVDLAGVPAALRRLLTRHAFVDIEARANWLHTALSEAAHAAGDPEHAGCIAKGWAADPAPDAHPALLCGERLHFHVPRTLLPIGTPTAVHLVAQGDEHHRTYTGFVVDRNDNITPIPLVPDSRDKIADTLAAVVLGVETPVHLGGTPKVMHGPTALTWMVEAMSTTDHMAIDWYTLAAIVGPRPDAEDERALLRMVSDNRYPWGSSNGTETR